MDRINASMKREIAKILLQDMQDPRLQFVSITQVSVSPDLENARVLFSFLGDRGQLTVIHDALKNAAGMVRKLVSHRMDLRRTPRIDFVYDPSLDYSANVDDILETIKKEIPFDEKGEEDSSADIAGEHVDDADENEEDEDDEQEDLTDEFIDGDER
jgi:ribosome-binding factor A